ncbi:MAG: hypothetical protein JXR14_12615 [Paracoccaceae bacterium]
MTEKSSEVRLTKMADASHEMPSAVDVARASGVDGNALLSRKIKEIEQLLWRPEGASETEIYERLVRALDLYESLAPADGAEGMLAMQMVGTHHAALEYLRRAALPNQTFAGRDLALKHAHKLMALYTQQLATLNKHRGKGQQKVTVEHVNVEAGGQAIVGHVDTGKPNRTQAEKKPAIAHDPEVPLPAPKAKKKTANKRRSG